MTTPINPFSKDEFTQFLLTFTLYRKFATALPASLPYSLVEFLPDRIYFDCPLCERNQAFVNKDSRYLDTSREDLEREIQENSAQILVAETIGGSKAVYNMMGSRAVGFYLLHYACSVCHEIELRWFLEITKDDEQTYIRKVGQEPPYDIGVSREMRNRLNVNDLNLYQRAKICISQSYGIGACIYLRRIVENQINPLLETHLEVREKEGAPTDELEKIRAIMGEPRMDSKVKLVTTPHATTGMNPVGRMYDKLSHGIHNCDDDECSSIAQEVLYVFDELLVDLRRRIDEEKAFKERMKALEMSPRRST